MRSSAGADADCPDDGAVAQRPACILRRTNIHVASFDTPDQAVDIFSLHGIPNRLNHGKLT
jgi:hypothetical protein